MSLPVLSLFSPSCRDAKEASMLSFALSMLSNALRVRWYDELRAGRERKWERMREIESEGDGGRGGWEGETDRRSGSRSTWTWWWRPKH